MAVLGKRKAREPKDKVSEEEANEIFRRHFEARFKPIEEPTPDRSAPAQTERDEDEDSAADEDSEESEWGGLSGGEDSEDEEEPETQVVEVIDHSSSQPPKPTAMSKRELRAFMSSRPPDQTTPAAEATTPTAKPTAPVPEDAPSLLAQDLELRRLLAESHLLAPTLSSSGVEPKAFATGRTRRKATDMRVQALGSKASILTQDKMPMHMRKGIVSAASSREAKRRREAKENGVILEREAPGKKRKKNQAGDFGVDRPGVGRLKGAQLRVSERDVKKIEGTRDTFGRRGRR